MMRARRINKDVSVSVDPRAERAQILDEAWRINRDFFYATNYHGADWAAMREKYRAFLPDLATRADLERVIEMMLSELAVGHSFQTPGDHPFKPAKMTQIALDALAKSPATAVKAPPLPVRVNSR